MASTEKPTALAVTAAAIPEVLRQRQQWICWKYESSASGWAKVPKQVSGRNARTNDPRTWSSFLAALRAYQSGDFDFDGIAYVFSASDPFVGVDLDGCRDPRTGGLSAEACGALDELASYTEISPSGTGCKVVGIGRRPTERSVYPIGLEALGQIEVYDQRRFWCLTGQVAPGCPAEVSDIQAALDRLCSCNWGFHDDGEPPASILAALARVEDDEGKAPVRPTSHGYCPQVERRAIAYLERCPAAVAGQGGHRTTFAVARALVYGFDLGAEAGYRLLQAHYNPRCQPPWSQKELLHKCQEADSKPFGKPRGYLLAGSSLRMSAPYRPREAPTSPGGGEGPGASTSNEPPPEPIIVQLSDVVAETVRWLWHGWMPSGTLVVLDGDPGLGKSTLTLDLTARITTGRLMPPGEGGDLRGPGCVLLLGAEDVLRYTVRPRLDAAGADNERVFALEGFRAADGHERPVGLPADLERMEEFIVGRGISLVVVDPLMAYLGTDIDAHKDQDVRRCLRPLARLAERTGTTILLLRHLNKLSGGPALYRGGSSIGITGAARASLIVGRDPDEDRFILAMNKCNLAPRPSSLAYRLVSAGGTCRIQWEGEADLRPDQILGHGGPSRRGPGRPDTQLQEAMRILADLLAAGEASVSSIKVVAEQAGVSWRTVETAKAELKITTRKGKGGWFWSLPQGTPQQTLSLEESADIDEDDEDDNPFLRYPE